MLKKTALSPKQTASASKNLVNYSVEPALLGALLKEKAKALKLKPKDIAEKIKNNWRSVYGIYKRRYLSIPEMKEWSELLGENLLLLYHPNVKPLPNPLQEELDKVKGYLKHLEDVENENGILKNRIIKLEAQLELLQEQLDKRNGR